MLCRREQWHHLLYIRNLDSSKFYTICLKLHCQPITKHICVFHFSPKATNYEKNLDYVNSKSEHILTHSPFIGVSILDLKFAPSLVGT